MGKEDPLVGNGGPSGREWRTLWWGMEHRGKKYNLQIMNFNCS